MTVLACTSVRPGAPIVNRTSTGADDGIRTRDPHLGKVMLYH